MKDESSTRDRLLRAAAELMDEAGGREVSTRAVCERAGVTAPTLYHHFGSKQALIDEVIGYGLRQYLSVPDTADPVADLRAGWDAHVGYGLANPTFYVLLHGRIRVGEPCGVTGPAQETLARLLRRAAERGLLRVPVPDAAARILAANVGVTLSLIGQPEGERDPHLSAGVRDAVLASVLSTEPGPATTRAQRAVSLRASLAADASGLTAGEATLLGELLDRLGRAPETRAADDSDGRARTDSDGDGRARTDSDGDGRARTDGDGRARETRADGGRAPETRADGDRAGRVPGGAA